MVIAAGLSRTAWRAIKLRGFESLLLAYRLK